MPDGEEALRLLERIGRIAYKSEDRIDDGYRPCPVCNGIGYIDPTNNPAFHRACPNAGYVLRDGKPVMDHPVCINGKTLQVEPSSHKFIKMILKAEQKAKMVIMVEKMLQVGVSVLDDGRREFKFLADDIVKKVYDYMKDNAAHESVIEHCSASVEFTTNRGISHQVVRHRIATFTQESTRACNYSKGRFGSEISVIDRTFRGKLQAGEGEVLEEKLKEAARIWTHVNETSERGYMDLIDLGISPDIARDVLTNALKTDVGMTANFREWRLVFNLRCSMHAHPDMRALMIPLRDEFRRRIPIIFDEV